MGRIYGRGVVFGFSSGMGVAAGPSVEQVGANGLVQDMQARLQEEAQMQPRLDVNRRWRYQTATATMAPVIIRSHDFMACLSEGAGFSSVSESDGPPVDELDKSSRLRGRLPLCLTEQPGSSNRKNRVRTRCSVSALAVRGYFMSLAWIQITASREHSLP